MTEQECIEVLKQPCYCDYDLSATIENCDISSCDRRDAMKMAIKALEEISLYKQDRLSLIPSDTFEILYEELEQYRALGTVEELRDARDKQVAKKPKGIDSDICPNCSTYNSVIPQRRNTVGCDTVYCWHCGTAIECEV